MPQPTKDAAWLAVLREELRTRRDAIRQVHDRGLAGTQVSARLASLVDLVLLRLFDCAIDSSAAGDPDKLRSQLAVVCLGSHARRQCAPYSDIDLMILHKSLSREKVAAVMRPLTQGVFDIGLQLGSSIRSPSEAVQLARNDVVICTSLIEARLLTGSRELFEEFRTGFERMVTRNSKSLCRQFLEARGEERSQFGESVYLLEPNVKRSRGSVRDLNLLRWLWFAEFQQSDPDRLHTMGVVSKFDHRRLQSATEFMLRLRNELHFHSGSAVDTLSRADQLRIADRLAYQPRRGMLPVEEFMRDYFRHTNHVWQMVRRREASLHSVPTTAVRVLDPLFSKTVDGHFRVGLKHLGATASGLDRMKTNWSDVLRVVQLSAELGKPLDQACYSTLLLAAPDFSADPPLEVRQQFYDLLAHAETVAPVLFLLHELGFLEKLIPAMRHARCLLQFNQYHKYTVDEHSLRTVAEAASFAGRDDELGRTYQSLEDKRPLHLTMLLHDLGKGYEEDHSEVGKQIAEETCALFQLEDGVTHDIVFLVHKHLMMSHLTFRRDTSDMRLLEGFTRQVGSIHRLEMLFVLTCADLAAVGPDVFNNWKRDVLTSVFLRTHALMEDDDSTDFRTKLSAQTALVLKALSHEQRGDPWYVRHLELLPTSQLISQSPERIVATLTRLKKISESSADAWCEYDADTKTIACTAGVPHGLGRGVFSSMAGALSGEGLAILSADIDALGENLLLVRYVATDSLSPVRVAEERLAVLAQRMVASLESDQPPRFRRVFNKEQEEASKKLSVLSNEVRIDTTVSDQFTIVEVYTFDRTGLLYGLARKLHELGVVIRHAKIDTFLDQVVDVFYVTHRDESKVTEPGVLDQLRQQLLAVICEE